jgi:hypothetical protein
VKCEPIMIPAAKRAELREIIRTAAWKTATSREYRLARPRVVILPRSFSPPYLRSRDAATALSVAARLQ